MPRRRPRLLKASHLPYTVRRRWWASAITAAIVPALALLAFGMVYMLLFFEPVPPGFGRPRNEWLFALLSSEGLKLILGRLAIVALALFAAIGTLLGIDRSFGYRVIIERDCIVTHGVLFRRRFAWGEMTGFQARSNYRLPGYYASFKVDGSNHPRRHWSSLWFGLYDIPPLMQFGGKELTALLRHAKRRAEAGWVDVPRKA